MSARNLRQATERTVHQRNLYTIGSQASTSNLDRPGIPIQAQEDAIGRGGRQYPRRVPSSPQRCIYVPTTRSDLQAIEYLLEKNRDVPADHFPLPLHTQFTGTTTGLNLSPNQMPSAAHSSMFTLPPSTRSRSSPQASGFHISM